MRSSRSTSRAKADLLSLSWRSPGRSFLVALGFLTRLPVPSSALAPGELRASLGAFPMVGVVVAMAGIAVRAATAPLLGRGTATVLALAAMTAVTGALHEDGLADVADGLAGGQSPATRLAIMKDPRLGTFGVLALVAEMGLRWTLLARLGQMDFARVVVLGAVLGRATVLVVAARLPAVSSGLGSALSGGPTKTAMIVGMATAVGIAVLSTGAWGWLPLAATGSATLLLAELFRRRMGGMSGDMLGASVVVGEVAAMLAAVALVHTRFVS